MLNVYETMFGETHIVCVRDSSEPFSDRQAIEDQIAAEQAGLTEVE